MVDATKFFAAGSASDSLTCAELQRRALADGREACDGRYVGTISDVSEELCYDRYKARHSPQLMIRFADDERCFLSKTMGRTLIALFGADTDGWIGRCICIFLRPMKRKRDEERKVEAAAPPPQLERVVMLAAPVAAAPAPTFKTFTRDNPPADYDDSPEALAFRAEDQDE